MSKVTLMINTLATVLEQLLENKIYIIMWIFDELTD